MLIVTRRRRVRRKVCKIVRLLHYSKVEEILIVASTWQHSKLDVDVTRVTESCGNRYVIKSRDLTFELVIVLGLYET